MPAKKNTAKSARAKRETIQTALSKAALQKVANKDVEQMMEEFRKQGVTSLEDLSKQLIASARAGLRGGLAFDAEDFPICYKFTTYRPVFDQRILTEVVGEIGQKLLR